MPAGVRVGALVLAVVVLTVACEGGTGLFPSRDPNVRGPYGDFTWAVEPGPEQAVGPLIAGELRDQVEAAQALFDEKLDQRFGIQLVAVFPNGDQAADQVEAIRGLLVDSAEWLLDPANRAELEHLEDPEQPVGLTPPEEAAMAAALLAAGDRGIGWGGPLADVDPLRAAEASVQAIGPVVIVRGLKSETGDELDPPLHPLAHLLSAAGAEVLLEGDRFGEGAIVVDQSCTIADPPSAEALLDEVGDAVETAQYWTVPPWVEPVGAGEALARATARRWHAATIQALDDERYLDYVERLTESIDDPAAYQAVLEEMSAYLAERTPQLVEGPVDREVLEVLTRQPATLDADPEERTAWLREAGGPMGQLRLVESEGGHAAPALGDLEVVLYGASVRLDGDRLDIAFAGGYRMTTAWPLILAYLGDRGCQDLRFRLVDYDLVRGD